MSEDKKICPFMTTNIPYNPNLNKQMFNVYCQKEECMAWGYVGDITDGSLTPSGELDTIPKYGCKLIDK